MKAIPLSLKQANNYIELNHRHHSVVRGDKFRIGCANDDGDLIGVVMVGRPVSRMLDDGKTLEVLRLCTTGDKNVCSFLYSRAARVAKELGYEHIITYILETEDGTSLKASGWSMEKEGAGGGSWDCPSRPRDVESAQVGLFWQDKPKYPTGKKTRWGKWL